MSSNNNSSVITVTYELPVKVSSLFLYQKSKAAPEDKWHMRSGVHFLFLKKQEQKPKHFIFIYFIFKN